MPHRCEQKIKTIAGMGLGSAKRAGRLRGGSSQWRGVRLASRLVDLSTSRSLGRSVSWSVVWTVRRLVGRLVGLSAGRSFGRSVGQSGRLVALSGGREFGRSAGRPVCRSADPLFAPLGLSAGRAFGRPVGRSAVWSVCRHRLNRHTTPRLQNPNCKPSGGSRSTI